MCLSPPDTSRMSMCGSTRVYYGSIRRIENLPFRRESPESWAITKHEACGCAGRGAVLLLAWLGHRGWGFGVIGGLGLVVRVIGLGYVRSDLIGLGF